jgi:hydroxyacylglutathione hydrolase
MLNIDIIPCLHDNYSYLLRDKETNTVAIVDPSNFSSCDEQIQKKYKKLDFILNTHHHFDHVGGNEELKKKYGAEILGFKEDKVRIPGIDRILANNENFKIGATSFEVIFIPGHTSGHVAFYSKNEKIIFSGDTLFSLGCGKVFEGTNEQMFNSINKFKKLPPETKIYCGHEYTKKNLEFCLQYEPDNEYLKKKKDWIDAKIQTDLPSIPVTVEEELKTNIFLRCDQQVVKNALNLNKSSEQEIFVKLRDLKDNF